MDDRNNELKQAQITLKLQKNRANLRKQRRKSRAFKQSKKVWETKKDQWEISNGKVKSLINDQKALQDEYNQHITHVKSVAKMDTIYKQMIHIVGSLAIKGKVID